MKKHTKLAYEFVFITTGFVLIFAVVYWGLGQFPDHALKPNAVHFYDYLYFSVVTISSLGYGDYHPMGLGRLVVGVQVLLGLVLVGVYISRLMSIRQETMIESIFSSNFTRGYDERISLVRNSREILSDLKRGVTKMDVIDENQFSLKYQNPFYNSYKSVNEMADYHEFSKHNNHCDAGPKIVQNRLADISWEYERLLGVLRKLLNVLDSKDVVWRNKTNFEYINLTCNMITGFLIKNEQGIADSFKELPKVKRIVGGKVRKKNFGMYHQLVTKQITSIKHVIGKA